MDQKTLKDLFELYQNACILKKKAERRLIKFTECLSEEDKLICGNEIIEQINLIRMSIKEDRRSSAQEVVRSSYVGLQNQLGLSNQSLRNQIDEQKLQFEQEIHQLQLLVKDYEFQKLEIQKTLDQQIFENQQITENFQNKFKDLTDQLLATGEKLQIAENDIQNLKAINLALQLKITQLETQTDEIFIPSHDLGQFVPDQIANYQIQSESQNLENNCVIQQENKELSNLTLQLEDLQNAIIQKDSEIQKVNATSDELTQMYLAKLKLQQEKINQFQKSQNSQEQQLNELQQKLLDQNLINLNLQEQLNNLQKTLQEKEFEIVQLKERVVFIQDDSDKRFEDKDLQITKLKETLSQSENTLVHKLKESIQLVSELEDKLAKQEIAHKVTIQDKDIEINKIQGEIEQKKDEILKLKEANDQNLLQLNEEKQLAIQEIQKDKENYKVSSEKQAQEFQKLQEAYVSEKNDFIKEIALQEELIKESKATLAKTEVISKQRISELNSQIEEISQKLIQEQQEHSLQNKSQEKELEDLKQINSEQSKLIVELEKLRQLLKDSEDQIAQIKQQNQIEVAELNKLIGESQQTSQNLQKALQDKEFEIVQLKERVVFIQDDSTKRLEDKEQQLSQLKDTMTKSENEQSHKLKESIQLVSELEDKLAKQEIAHKVTIQDKDIEINKIQGEIEQKKDEILKLTEANDQNLLQLNEEKQLAIQEIQKDKENYKVSSEKQAQEFQKLQEAYVSEKNDFIKEIALQEELIKESKATLAQTEVISKQRISELNSKIEEISQKLIQEQQEYSQQNTSQLTELQGLKLINNEQSKQIVELEKLKQLLKDSENTIAQIKQQNEGEVVELNKLISESKQNSQNLQKTLQEKEFEIVQLKERVVFIQDDSDKRFEDKDLQITKLKDTLSQSENTLVHKLKESIQLVSELEDKLAQQEIVKQVIIQDKDIEINKIQGEIEQKKDEILKLKEANDQNSLQLNEEKQLAIQEIQKDKENYKVSSEKQAQEFQKLQEAYVSEKNDFIKEIALQEELIKESKATLAQTEVISKQRISELNSQIEEISQKLIQEQQEHSLQNKSQEKELEDLKQINSEQSKLIVELEKLRQLLKDSEDQIAQIKQQNQIEVAELNKLIGESQQTSQNLQKALQDKEFEIVQLKERVVFIQDDSTKRLEDKEQQLSQLKDTMTKSENEQSHKLKESIQLVSELEDKLAKQEIAHKVTIQDKDIEINKIQGEIEQKKDEILKLKEANDQNLLQLNEEKQLAIQEIQKDKENYKVSSEKQAQEFQKLQEAYVSEKNDFIKEIALQEELIKESKATLAQTEVISKQRISELNSQIEEISQKLIQEQQEHSLQNKSQEKELEDLKQINSEQSKQIVELEKLRQLLKDSEDSIAQIKQQNQIEVAELNKLIGESQQTSQNLQKALQDKEFEIVQLKERVVFIQDDSTKRLEDKEQQLSQLKDTMTKSENEQSHKLKESIQLVSELEDKLAKQESAHKVTIQDKDIEINKIQGEIEQKKDEILKLKEANDQNLLQLNEEKQLAIQEIQKDKENYKVSSEKQAQEFQKLQEAYVSEKNDFIKEIALQEELIKESKATLAQAEVISKQRISELNSQIEEISQKLIQEQQEHSLQNKSQEKELEDLKQINSEQSILIVELEKLRQLLKDSEDSIAQIKQQNQIEVAELNKLIGESQQTSQNLQKALQDKEFEIVQLKERVVFIQDDSTKRLEDKEQQLSQLKDTMTKSENEQSHKLKESIQLVSELEDKLAKQEIAHKVTIQDKDIEINKIQGEIEQKKDEILKLKEANDQNLLQLNEEKQLAIQEIQKDKENYKVSSEKQAQEFQKLQEAYVSEKNDLITQHIEKLNNTLEELTETNRLKDLSQNQLKQEKEINLQLNQTINDFEQKYQQLEEDHTNLTKRFQQLVQQNQDLSKSQSELEQLQIKNEESSQKVDELNSQLKEQNQQINNLTEQLQKSNRDSIFQLKQQQSKFEEQLNNVSSKIFFYLDQFIEKEKFLQAEIQDLNKKITQSKEKETQLNQQNQKIQLLYADQLKILSKQLEQTKKSINNASNQPSPSLEQAKYNKPDEDKFKVILSKQNEDLKQVKLQFITAQQQFYKQEQEYKSNLTKLEKLIQNNNHSEALIFIQELEQQFVNSLENSSLEQSPNGKQIEPTFGLHKMQSTPLNIVSRSLNFADSTKYVLAKARASGGSHRNTQNFDNKILKQTPTVNCQSSDSQDLEYILNDISDKDVSQW